MVFGGCIRIEFVEEQGFQFGVNELWRDDKKCLFKIHIYYLLKTPLVGKCPGGYFLGGKIRANVLEECPGDFGGLRSPGEMSDTRE